MKSLGYILILIGFSSQVFASKIKSAEELVKQIKKEQEQVAKKEEAKRNVLSELYGVSKNLQKLNGERSKIEKNLRKTTENVNALTSLIYQMDGKLSLQRKHLRERMKALSKLQGQGFVRILFGSQSAADRQMNLRVIKAITERDFRLIKQHKDNLDVYRVQKQKLDVQEHRLATLKQNLDGKEKTLGAQVVKKNEMLKNIDSETILHSAKLRRLRLETSANSQAVEELKKIRALEDLFSEKIFERKGSLSSPVNGRIKIQYGWLPDVDLKTKIRFKGNLIDAKLGEPVKSVYRGQVVLAESVAGYGKTIVVDHGNHYYSVYSNLGDFDAKSGQEVAEGQRLGSAGSQEAFFGSGIYFELRHFTDTENPSDWVRLTAGK